ncbi:MAG: tetratricopeptide repeat protein, partial [Anaerolineales bacterium]|nr:tetratricopeptide repeat protein [Anaerolineales bacterium]
MAKKSSTVKKAVKTGKQKSKSTKKQAEKQTSRVVVKLSNKQLNDMLSEARDLQWAGQHEKAIEVCTQALDAIGKGNSRTAQIQMDLLDTRAESHFAVLNLDAFHKDARLMMRIANAAPASSKRKKLAYKAKALIWKGRVHTFIDNKNELARKTLSNALKLARQSKDKHLEAESLYWLGANQTGEQQLKTGYEALEMFKSLGEQHGLARILNGLGMVHRAAGRTKEARKYAKTALGISEQIGFNREKYAALNTLSITETDLGKAITSLKQIFHVAEASGYKGPLASNANNLGFRYSDLGLYPRALRYFKKSLDFQPASWGAVQLSNIVHIEIEKR